MGQTKLSRLLGKDSYFEYWDLLQRFANTDRTGYQIVAKRPI